MIQPNSYFVFGMAQTCTFSELESLLYRHSRIKNLFMLSVRTLSYKCTREVWRAQKYVRVAQGAAESNCSFLSALQTSQVHP